VASSAKSKASYEITLSNPSVSGEILPQRFTEITLEILKADGVISGAVAHVLFVCVADLNMAYRVDILSAKTVF
jgi:hypothetical protein